MAEIKKQEEILQLGRTLLKLRSTMDAAHLKNIFKEMSFMDYEVLSLLGAKLNLHTADKIYLSEVSKELDIPIQRVSAMVKNLQGKGFVYWTHDKSGTYIKLSELGKETMEAQQHKLMEYFSAIVDRIGMEEFKKILHKMEELEEIMVDESMKM